MLVGYMPISSDSDRQTTDLQRDALLLYWCSKAQTSYWVSIAANDRGTDHSHGVPDHASSPVQIGSDVR